METAIIGFLISTFSVVNLVHVIIPMLRTPAGSMPVGISHWYEDYFYYVAHMTQGAKGMWLTINPFTEEAVKPTINWFFTLLWGKLTAPLGAPPFYVYDIGLFLGGILSLVLAYLVIKKLFPKSTATRIVTMILFLVSTGFFRIIREGEGLTIIPYQYTYAVTLSLNRLGGVFHHMLLNSFSLLSFLLYANILSEVLSGGKISRRQILIFSLIITALLISSSFAGAINLSLMGAATLILLGVNKKMRYLVRFIPLTLCVGAAILLPLYFHWQTFRDPFWRYTINWESRMIPPPSLATFFLAVGPLLLLLPFGIYPFIRKMTPLKILGILFAFVPAILFCTPIPAVFGILYTRILQPAQYVFLAAVGAEGLFFLAGKLRILTRVKSVSLIPTILVSLYILVSVPSIAAEVQNRMKAADEFAYVNSLDPNIYRGLRFLYGEPDGLVLSPYTVSLFVPVVAGKTSFLGHRSLTIGFDEKLANLYKYFELRFTPGDATAFLKKHTVRYVAFSGAEMWQKNLTNTYPYLVPVFVSPTFVIYEFRFTGKE